MCVKAIYHGLQLLLKIFHNGEVINFQNPITFHSIEDGKLIILGAYTANSLSDGLYLDCVPNVEWIYPAQDGNVLTIEQVYSATQIENVLEVE